MFSFAHLFSSVLSLYYMCYSVSPVTMIHDNHSDLDFWIDCDSFLWDDFVYSLMKPISSDQQKHFTYRAQ